MKHLIATAVMNIKTTYPVNRADYSHLLDNDYAYNIFCYFIQFIENNMHIGTSFNDYLQAAIHNKYIMNISAKLKISPNIIITQIINHNNNGLFDIYFSKANINLHFKNLPIKNMEYANFAEFKQKFADAILHEANDYDDDSILDELEYAQQRTNLPVENVILGQICETCIYMSKYIILNRITNISNKLEQDKLLDDILADSAADDTGSRINTIRNIYEFIYNYVLKLDAAQPILNRIKNIISQNKLVNNYSTYFDELPDVKGTTSVINFDVHDIDKRDAPILTLSVKNGNNIDDYVIIGKMFEHHSDIMQENKSLFNDNIKWDPEYLYGHSAIIDASRVTKYSDAELVDLLKNKINNRNVKITKIYKYNDDNGYKSVTRLAKRVY